MNAPPTISWFRTLRGSVSSLVVWALHFAVSYALVGIGCDAGWQRLPFAGVNALTALLIALTLPALALIAWIGWRGWRTYRRANPPGPSEVIARWRFLGLVTLAVAVLAFVSAVMTAVPMLLLPPCA